MRRFNLVMTLIVGILGSGLVGCNKPPTDTPPNPTNSKVKSNLIVSSYTAIMDGEYPPYSFRSEKGEAIGFDVDMLHSIGQIEGFSVEIEPNSWSSIIPSVANSKYVIGLGGIAKSDIEEAGMSDNLLMSTPYHYGQDAVATHANNNFIDIHAINTINSIKDLRIATIENTGYMIDIKRIKHNQMHDIITEPTTFLAYKDLFNGKADIVLADKGVLEYLKQSNPQLPIAIGGRGAYFDEPYGMVFIVAKSHPQLQAKINHGMQILLDNGTYAKLHQKWFGVSPNYTPGKMMVDKLMTTASSTNVNINPNK